jgi:release factor glutamine methyltransferase
MLCSTQLLRRQLADKITPVYPSREADQIAALIIEHFFNISGTSQLLQNKIDLSQKIEHQLDTICKRLLDHEPIQYVLGYTEFYGRRFKTDCRALIPRPETEELVHLILSNNISAETCVLDIGAGSGCIAITLSLETGCKCIALDIDPLALALTAENADLLETEIELIQANLLTDQPKLPALDIIVSNPPYVPEADFGQLECRVTSFEPHRALFVPDSNSLVFYQRIAHLAPKYLQPGGQVFLEIYHLAGQEVKALFKTPQWSQVQIKKDLQTRDRFVRATLSL